LSSAILLAEVPHDTDLASTAFYDASATFPLPAVADGAYKFVVVTDAAKAVYEGTHENNNLQASASNVQIGHADLVPSFVSPPVTTTSGTSLTLDWSVLNSGTTPAIGPWVDRVFLSDDAVLGAGDRLLGEFSQPGFRWRDDPHRYLGRQVLARQGGRYRPGDRAVG
jgi:hypothetical protein